MLTRSGDAAGVHEELSRLGVHGTPYVDGVPLAEPPARALSLAPSPRTATSAWQRRAAAPAIGFAPAAPSLPDLLPRRTRLMQAAALRPTACLAGDTVGRRPALHAPGLGRPVAFLDGRPVAPLLEQLRTAPPWPRRWSSGSGPRPAGGGSSPTGSTGTTSWRSPSRDARQNLVPPGTTPTGQRGRCCQSRGERP
jgi:hypothetical protein